jgi:hypothetical protein
MNRKNFKRLVVGLTRMILNEERDFVDPNDPNDPAYTVIKNPENPTSTVNSSENPFEYNDDEEPIDYINRIKKILRKEENINYDTINKLTDAFDTLKAKNGRLFTEVSSTIVGDTGRRNIPISRVIQYLYAQLGFDPEMGKSTEYFDVKNTLPGGGGFNLRPDDGNTVTLSTSIYAPAWEQLINAFSRQQTKTVEVHHKGTFFTSSKTKTKKVKIPPVPKNHKIFQDLNFLKNCDISVEVSSKEFDVLASEKPHNFLYEPIIKKLYSEETMEYLDALERVVSFMMDKYADIDGDIIIDGYDGGLPLYIFMPTTGLTFLSLEADIYKIFSDIAKAIKHRTKLNERFVNKKAKLITERILSKIKRL